MANVEPYDAGIVKRIAQTIGDTDRGLTGGEIGELLDELGLDDQGESTKWRRIHAALVHEQQRTGSGTCVLSLVKTAMKPARWADRARFEVLRSELNEALLFAGVELRPDGELLRVDPASTHDEVASRTRRLRKELERRGCHQEVFRYCTQELLNEDYFTAVFEAVKGLAEYTRERSGLDLDGHQLVDAALLGSSPRLAINKLETETELNEQRGLANIMKGIFSAFRNPAAHEPRVIWEVTEADALDLFATLSLVYRRLEKAAVVPRSW